MKLQNPDSRFRKWLMKAMTAEVTMGRSRRDAGGPFPVGADKRKLRVDLAGARSGVRYLLTLQSVRGIQEKRAEERGDSHPREAARLVACQ